MALVALLLVFVFGAYACSLETPQGVQQALAGAAPTEATRAESLLVTDRDGVPVRELLTEQHERRSKRALEAFGPKLPKALLAAEDKRFYSHPGVDPIATLRTAWASLRAGRVVGGASTITQQLARSLDQTPRSGRGKLRVLALSLRLEVAYSKDQILEAYLNEVSFGPRLRGAQAAARYYFGKDASELSWAEAASLAAIVRGPSLYNPERRPEILLRRRDRVLDRLEDNGELSPTEALRARGEPLTLALREEPVKAPHFVRALTSGKLSLLAPTADTSGRLRSTLSARLQRESTQSAQQVVKSLSDRNVSAASVVVVDNESGQILAYVGSPDQADERALGHNDGVLALRQPGSSLKPFLYQLAIEKNAILPSSVLPDVPLSFATPEGSFFRPDNYDRRFRGPVWARDALANSYNVPAVVLAEKVGVPSLLGRLRELGFSSLDQSPEHYGLALALGDGEVRLLELARAYATLARGGLLQPVCGALQAGQTSCGAPERVLEPTAAFLTLDILSDRRARQAAFGPHSPLEFEFPAATKTGTSKGYRDNIAVGTTPSVTVAVWVGNFDGSPMRDVSGVSGAGPLMHQVMLAAMRDREPQDFPLPSSLARQELCSLSGKRAHGGCAHRREEWLPKNHESEACDMHIERHVVVSSGDLAGSACNKPTRLAAFETYPAVYAEWATQAARPLSPTRYDAQCPAGSHDPLPAVRSGVRILFPQAGARFYRESGGDPSIVVRVASPSGSTPRLVLDGRVLSQPQVVLTQGHHKLSAQSGADSDEVEFSVE